MKVCHFTNPLSISNIITLVNSSWSGKNEWASCVIIIISGTEHHTHACVALTEGLCPDGNGTTTYCTTNTSFKSPASTGLNMGWDKGQTMHYLSPPNLHHFHST